MPKLDEAKERLGILKFWLGMVVGVFVALCAWLANHYKIEDDFLFILALIIELLLVVAIYVLNNRMMKILKEIRDLKK